MTHAISGSAGQRPPPPPPPAHAKPSEEQLTALKELLEEYDAQSLTDDEAAALVSDIKELGIHPGKELGEVLTEAGFDPQELREQAGGSPSGPPPPPPPSVNSDAIALLTQLLEEHGQEDVSSDDIESIITKLTEAGFDTSKPLLDIQA